MADQRAQVITISLYPDELLALDMIAARLGSTRSNAIRHLLTSQAGDKSGEKSK